jgi:ribonuclease HI
VTTLFCDASTHNNGKEGQLSEFAVVKQDPLTIEGVLLTHQICGDKTSPEAEYAAVIWALEYAKKDLSVTKIITDAILITGHVFNGWKTTSKFQPLRDYVQALLTETGCKLEWRPRHENLAGHFFEKRQRIRNSLRNRHQKI